MIAFVISKREFDLVLENKLRHEPNVVCIGSFNDIDEAREATKYFPCLTDVVIRGLIHKCIYIICNV